MSTTVTVLRPREARTFRIPVCMYVCMCACVCVCVYIYIYIYIYIQSVCVCVTKRESDEERAHIHTCIHTSVYACLQGQGRGGGPKSCTSCPQRTQYQAK